MRLSSDLSFLEVASARDAPPDLRLRLASVVHMAHGATAHGLSRSAAELAAERFAGGAEQGTGYRVQGGSRVQGGYRVQGGAARVALRMSFVGLSPSGSLHLLASEAAQLAFWWTGLQGLTSTPPAERLSRGAVLWRAAAALYRSRRGSDEIVLGLCWDGVTWTPRPNPSSMSAPLPTSYNLLRPLLAPPPTCSAPATADLL